MPYSGFGAQELIILYGFRMAKTVVFSKQHDFTISFNMGSAKSMPYSVYGLKNWLFYCVSLQSQNRGFWEHDDFTISFRLGSAKSMPHSGLWAEEIHCFTVVLTRQKQWFSKLFQLLIGFPILLSFFRSKKSSVGNLPKVWKVS